MKIWFSSKIWQPDETNLKFFPTSVIFYILHKLKESFGTHSISYSLNFCIFVSIIFMFSKLAPFPVASTTFRFASAIYWAWFNSVYSTKEDKSLGMWQVTLESMIQPLFLFLGELNINYWFKIRLHKDDLKHINRITYVLRPKESLTLA